MTLASALLMLSFKVLQLRTNRARIENKPRTFKTSTPFEGLHKRRDERQQQRLVDFLRVSVGQGYVRPVVNGLETDR